MMNVSLIYVEIPIDIDVMICLIFYTCQPITCGEYFADNSQFTSYSWKKSKNNSNCLII